MKDNTGRELVEVRGWDRVTEYYSLLKENMYVLVS